MTPARPDRGGSLRRAREASVTDSRPLGVYPATLSVPAPPSPLDPPIKLHVHRPGIGGVGVGAREATVTRQTAVRPASASDQFCACAIHPSRSADNAPRRPRMAA